MMPEFTIKVTLMTGKMLINTEAKTEDEALSLVEKYLKRESVAYIALESEV